MTVSDIAICSKCHMVQFQVKYYFCPSQHTICGHCFKTKRDRGTKCPTCKQVFLDPPPRNADVERAITIDLRLVGPCRHLYKGCDFEGTKYKVQEHERKDCKYQKVACTSTDCLSWIRREALPAHLKEKHGITSDEAPVPNPSNTVYHCHNRNRCCPFESPSREEVHLHQRSDCPFLRVMCPHSNTCWKKVMFKDLAEHVRVKHWHLKETEVSDGIKC